MIVKTDKDPEGVNELFANVNSSTSPIIINPTESTTHEPINRFFYFASTPIRTMLANRQQSSVVFEEEKFQEVKTGKRKAPEMIDKYIDGSFKSDIKSDYDGCLICYRLYQDGDNMIQCDGTCNGWYHIECVNLSYKRFKQIALDQEWVCNFCFNGINPHSVRNNKKKLKNAYNCNS